MWIMTEIYLMCSQLLSDVFEEFVERSLLPHVLPFNGTNPHSVIILENCLIHHVDHVVDLMESMGVLVIFLPPYSPDLNPIEEAFSKVKACLKANELAFEVLDDPTDILLGAFASTTQKRTVSSG